MSDETGGAGRPSPDDGGNGGPPAGGGRGGDSPDRREECASGTKAALLREFEQKNDNPTRWPWWGQFLLALAALGTACVLLIAIPTYIAPTHIVPKTDGGEVGTTNLLPLTTLIVVFIGLTTMTISAMFLFMTFRIDRGTKTTAQRVAGKVARKVAVDKMTKDTVGKICDIEKIGEDAKRCIKEAGNERGQRADRACNGRGQGRG